MGTILWVIFWYDDKMTFLLLEKVEKYLKSDVVTPLVSIVNTVSKFYTIERSEIEDVIHLVQI